MPIKDRVLLVPTTLNLEYDCLTLFLPPLEPPRLDAETIKDVEQAIYAIEDKYPDLPVIIEGGGDDFCLGLDYEQITSQEDHGLSTLQRAEKVLRALDKLNNFKIAILQGRSYGWGASLALCCDCRFMEEHATIKWDELSHGFTPGLGAWKLPQYVGMGRAQRLLTRGVELNFEQAMAYGLADYAFDVHEVTHVLADLLKYPNAALRASRKLMQNAFTADADNALGTAMAAQAMCLNHLSAPKS